MSFIELYLQYSTGKDKYLRFQIAWHNHCSVYLLPRDSSSECIIPNLSDKLPELRSSWLEFCDKHQETQTCYNIMTLLSSSVYTILLDYVQSLITKTMDNETVSIPDYNDGEDVNIRFGGCVLSSMIHLRYKHIRNCSENRKDLVSMEITILHAINTKEKSEMPSYLKYRDRGFMYSPNPHIVPFIREVDKSIRVVLNEKGFQEHGNDLVKVNHYIIMWRTLFHVGSSLHC